MTDELNIIYGKDRFLADFSIYLNRQEDLFLTEEISTNSPGYQGTVTGSAGSPMSTSAWDPLTRS